MVRRQFELAGADLVSRELSLDRGSGAVPPFSTGDTLQVECPTGSVRMMNLRQVARELAARLTSLFLPDGAGAAECHGDDPRFARDEHWARVGLVLRVVSTAKRGVAWGPRTRRAGPALVAPLLDDLASP